MRLDRLLSITIMLINRRKITAPNLAEHFGVSIRTIYRDLEAISAAGIPVISCPGFEGGFQIMENYRMNRQVLTFEEILSVLTTLKGVNTTLENRVLDEAIEKIGCLIPEEKEEEYKSKSEWIAFDIERWGTSDRQQTLFKDLHQAISEQKTVCFSYTNHNSSTLTRTVEPMTLLFKSYSWYLFGFCRIRRDFRLFKLSRIRNFSFLNDRFVRKQKSYRDILSKNGTSAKFVDLELHFISQAKNKVEEFFEPGQIRINPDGSLMVAISVPEDEWIYSWILSFGDTVTVVRPRHIRDRLLEILKKMGKKYVT